MGRIERWAKEGGLIRARNENAKAYRNAQAEWNKDVGALMKKLRSLPEELEEQALKEVLTAGGDVIRDEARRKVSKQSRNLERSIKTFGWRKRSKSVVVGPRFPRKDRVTGAKPDYYGGYLEFGTRKMAARPYMRPAYDSSKGEALRVIKDGISGAINKWITRNKV